MDSNLETISNEIIETSSNTSVNLPEKPKKSKGLLAATIIFAILALAGIGFGVYGFFFYKNPNCLTNCISNDTSQNPTNNSDINAPSISEVEEILESKYGFTEIQNSFSDNLFLHLNAFDNQTKIGFLVMTLLRDAPGESNPEVPDIVKEISYDTLNEAYHSYFGDDSDIAKEDISFGNTFIGLASIVYNEANSNFEAHFRDGIGGVSFLYQLNKVVSVSGSQDKFTATLITSNIDTEVTQSVKEPLNRTSIGNDDESYYIYMPETTLESIHDNIFAYNLNFIKEDGEYKLISIEKQ